MLEAFYQNPMAWIALIFSILGATGFYLFIVGFLAGLPHLFTISAHEEHLDHHRLRATRGVLIMIHAYIVWEIVRLIASWFGGPAVDAGLVSGILSAYIILFIILQIAFGITNTITGGEGH